MTISNRIKIYLKILDYIYLIFSILFIPYAFILWMFWGSAYANEGYPKGLFVSYLMLLIPFLPLLHYISLFILRKITKPIITYKIIEGLYIFCLIIFLILISIPMEKFTEIFVKCYINLNILYLVVIVPFWPIILYFISLLLRKKKKHRQRTI